MHLNNLSNPFKVGDFILRSDRDSLFATSSIVWEIIGIQEDRYIVADTKRKIANQFLLFIRSDRYEKLEDETLLKEAIINSLRNEINEKTE